MTVVEERWGGYDAGWRAGIPGPLAKRHGKLRRKVAPVGRREGGRETRKRVGKRKRWENGRGELGGGGARKGRMIVQREGGREMAK